MAVRPIVRLRGRGMHRAMPRIVAEGRRVPGAATLRRRLAGQTDKYNATIARRQQARAHLVAGPHRLATTIGRRTAAATGATRLRNVRTVRRRAPTRRLSAATRRRAAAIPRHRGRTRHRAAVTPRLRAAVIPLPAAPAAEEIAAVEEAEDHRTVVVAADRLRTVTASLTFIWSLRPVLPSRTGFFFVGVPLVSSQWAATPVLPEC
jgi:hypothetical protein